MSPAILIWAAALSFAQDCPPTVAETITTLEAEATRAAYECLAKNDEAGAALIARLADPAVTQPGRVSRALAVWRLHRLDAEIPAEESRAYLPDERRLVGDGVRAFRGRPSPSPDHTMVFEQLPWYKPNPNYTDGRLSDLDKKNIQILDNPPALAAPEGPPSAADAMAEAPTAPPPRQSSGCGSCATNEGDLAAGLAGLGLSLGLLLRRRR
ncbi:hypothetical protein L6R49_13350 [Myxococcota bacterium]|nr:hypothetical protein [Myxococcota bacterium]